MPRIGSVVLGTASAVVAVLMLLALLGVQMSVQPPSPTMVRIVSSLTLAVFAYACGVWALFDLGISDARRGKLEDEMGSVFAGAALMFLGTFFLLYAIAGFGAFSARCVEASMLVTALTLVAYAIYREIALSRRQ